MNKVVFVERIPMVDEYAALIAAVGWKSRDPEAIELALANSQFTVCAQIADQMVGMGRVIGDGGLHLYLSDVVVRPEHQRRGIGQGIVRRLNGYLESLPYRNMLIGIITAPGTQEFYEQFGYNAQSPQAPAMYRWLNELEAPDAAGQ